MDYSDVRKVVEETDINRVQVYLATKRWSILTLAPGQREDRSAYCLYVLGWYGPFDPDCPDLDHSEFPEGLDENSLGQEGI